MNGPTINSLLRRCSGTVSCYCTTGHSMLTTGAIYHHSQFQAVCPYLTLLLVEINCLIITVDRPITSTAKWPPHNDVCRGSITSNRSEGCNKVFSFIAFISILIHFRIVIVMTSECQRDHKLVSLPPISGASESVYSGRNGSENGKLLK